MNAVSPVMYGRTVEPADRDTEEGISQRVECPPPGDPKCFLSAEILGCPVPLFLSEGLSVGCGMRKPNSHEPWRWGRPSLPHFLPLERISFGNGSGFESILCPP